MAFEATLWQNITQQVMKLEVNYSLLLLPVAPPLMLYPATPINSLAVPSPSLGVYRYNKLDMRMFCEQNFPIVSITLCFISSGSSSYQWE